MTNRISILAFAILSNLSTTKALDLTLEQITSRIKSPETIKGVIKKPNDHYSLQTIDWLFNTKRDSGGEIVFAGEMLHKARNNPKAWVLHIARDYDITPKDIEKLFPNKKLLYTHIEDFMTPDRYYLITKGPLSGSILNYSNYTGRGMGGFSIESQSYSSETVRAIKNDRDSPWHDLEDLRQIAEIYFYFTDKKGFCKIDYIKCAP